MPDTSVNNKRIAKNTLFLYLRMIVVMGIGLYTVRAILDLLGVVDYGIYNVVGGVVSMFSFINSTLATSSQRYFSIELAKDDQERLNKWFCLNITTFAIFIVIFLIIAETVGLWFVNTQMTIPQERMYAANIVYQFSIITFCIHFFSIPYNALIIAHEKMGAFAYISIVEAISKLAIVFVLSIITWDKLIIYALLMFITSCGITLFYVLYNKKKFSETKFRPYWNKKEMIELLSFSGWHFLGTFSIVIRSQGINILINMFFSPAVNAARAVAYQVYHAVSQLSSNFFVAVKPQIYKSYASNDYEAMYKLILRSSLLTSFLVSILIYPILANTPYILSLWLKEVPNYAIIFTKLVLINGLIDATNGPTTASILATGKIKIYELTVANMTIAILPISYIALKLGAEPTVTMIVSILISIVVTITRAVFLNKMIKFPLKMYFFTIGKIFVVTIFTLIFIKMTFLYSSTNLISFIGNSFLIFVLLIFIYIFIILDTSDKHFLKTIITRYYHDRIRT